MDRSFAVPPQSEGPHPRWSRSHNPPRYEVADPPESKPATIHPREQRALEQSHFARFVRPHYPQAVAITRSFGETRQRVNRLWLSSPSQPTRHGVIPRLVVHRRQLLLFVS